MWRITICTALLSITTLFTLFPTFYFTTHLWSSCDIAGSEASNLPQDMESALTFRAILTLLISAKRHRYFITVWSSFETETYGTEKLATVSQSGRQWINYHCVTVCRQNDICWCYVETLSANGVPGPLISGVSSTQCLCGHSSMVAMKLDLVNNIPCATSPGLLFNTFHGGF